MITITLQIRTLLALVSQHSFTISDSVNNLASLLHLSVNKFLCRIVLFVINACELGGRKSRQNIFIFPVPFSFSGINDNDIGQYTHVSHIHFIVFYIHKSCIFLHVLQI